MTFNPGPRNLITDVDGVSVGNAERAGAFTGTTAILFDHASVASADVRGGGPATRDTELLNPEYSVETVDAIALSGGSVYGLTAADGIIRHLAGQGRGFAVGPYRVPIVPGACIFDLLTGGGAAIMAEPFYPELGRAAAMAAAKDFQLGNVGAGIGARAGNLKGGLGSASVVTDSGLQVGALAVVNCVGSVVMDDLGAMWAWPFEEKGEFGGQRPQAAMRAGRDVFRESRIAEAQEPENTTLVLVATNAKLNSAWAKRVAMMAHDGMAQAIRPVHTPFDGDTIFTVATAAWQNEVTAADLTQIGMLAADCTARAIARGVYEAEDLNAVESYRSRYLNT